MKYSVNWFVLVAIFFSMISPIVQAQQLSESDENILYRILREYPGSSYKDGVITFVLSKNKIITLNSDGVALNEVFTSWDTIVKLKREMIVKQEGQVKRDVLQVIDKSLRPVFSLTRAAFDNNALTDFLALASLVHPLRDKLEESKIVDQEAIPQEGSSFGKMIGGVVIVGLLIAAGVAIYIIIDEYQKSKKVRVGVNWGVDVDLDAVGGFAETCKKKMGEWEKSLKKRFR